jgi:hypothetical protein
MTCYRVWTWTRNIHLLYLICKYLCYCLLMIQFYCPGLQKDYNNSWINCIVVHLKLLVNIDKTTVTVFQRGRPNTSSQWFYNGQCIETVASFVYLGILLNSNGRWISTHKRIADQASRALHGVISSFEHIESTMLSVWNIGQACPRLWCRNLGISSGWYSERIHQTVCKRIQSVRKSASNSAVLGELGRYTLVENMKWRIIKYWLNILTSGDTLLYKTYCMLRRGADAGDN